MLRDPISVIPSGLSLVTGVLDKKFNFWSLEDEIKNRFIERLYSALIELLNRFHDDWVHNKINKEKVFIVRFDNMMNNFEELMNDLSVFVEFERDNDLIQEIEKTGISQRIYKSEHSYDLSRFGLTESQIKKDCKKIYETFLREK